MKIAFVNPPRIGRRKRAIEAEDCCWGIGPLVLPAMLLGCASEAYQAGHEVVFWDAAIDPEREMIPKPDLIVHPLAWHYHKMVNQAMIELCGDVPRVALAVPPGYAAHYSKLEGVDYSIADSPEIAFGHVPGSADNLVDWEWPPKLGLADTVDTDYDLVPERYWRHYVAAVYQVTRGCCYSCHFCVWGGSTCTSAGWEIKSAERVAREIGVLRALATRYAGAEIDTGQPLPLYLLASQLTIDLSWLREFHEHMSPDPYQFQSNVNLADLTAEKLVLLKECGLVSTGIGMEGLTTPLLKKLGKPYTFERAVHGLLTLQEVGLKTRVHLRYGYGEIKTDVQEAVENVGLMHEAGIKPLRVDLAPIVHYEGTRIKEQADYELIPLPKRGVDCLVMKYPPDWAPVVDAMKALEWQVAVGARK